MAKDYHLIRVDPGDPRYFLVLGKNLLMCGHRDWILEEYSDLINLIEIHASYADRHLIESEKAAEGFVDAVFRCADTEGATCPELSWHRSTYILSGGTRTPVVRRKFLEYANYLFAHPAEGGDEYLPDLMYAIRNPSLHFGNITGGDMAVVADLIGHQHSIENLGLIAYWNIQHSVDAKFPNFVNPVNNRLDGEALYKAAKSIVSTELQNREVPSWFKRNEQFTPGTPVEAEQFAVNTLGVVGVIGLVTWLAAAKSVSTPLGYNETRNAIDLYDTMFERHHWSELYLSLRAITNIFFGRRNRLPVDTSDLRRGLVAYIRESEIPPALIAGYVNAGAFDSTSIKQYIESGVAPDLVDSLAS